jgi:hypothetical protein
MGLQGSELAGHVARVLACRIVIDKSLPNRRLADRPGYFFSGTGRAPIIIGESGFTGAHDPEFKCPASSRTFSFTQNRASMAPRGGQRPTLTLSLDKEVSTGIPAAHLGSRKSIRHK